MLDPNPPLPGDGNSGLPRMESRWRDSPSPINKLTCISASALAPGAHRVFRPCRGRIGLCSFQAAIQPNGIE